MVTLINDASFFSPEFDDESKWSYARIEESVGAKEVSMSNVTVAVDVHVAFKGRFIVFEF